MPQQPDRRKQPRDPNGSESQEFIMDTRRNSGNRRATPTRDAASSSQGRESREPQIPRDPSRMPRRDAGQRRPQESATRRDGQGVRPIPVRGQNGGQRREEPRGVNPRRDARSAGDPRRAPRPDNDDTARFEPPRRTNPGRLSAPRPVRGERRDPRAGERPGTSPRSTQAANGRPAERRAPQVRREPRVGNPDDIRFDEASGAYVSGSASGQKPAQKQGQRPPRPMRRTSSESPQDPREARRGAHPIPTRPGGRPSGASPIGPADGDGGDGSGDGAGKKKRRFGRGKKILAGFLVLVLLWFAGLIWAGTSAWDKVTKVDAMPAHTASKGSGTNILLVGSDGREGLTNEQKRKLGTGSAEGQRTDSIMVLHIGGPKPTLMSIPRDSYVAIPGYGKNKINAAFSIGGPKLLIQTIEQDTGIYINDYMEIGFGGFASVVDAVGGVRICVAFDMNDKKAHINLKKGCQTLNGANALGYVRARYSDPEGDIGRAKRQRQFLGALMKKISSPTNLLFPWKLKGLGESGAQGLSVDKNMGIFTAARAMWTLKGLSGSNGNSVSVPLDNTALYTPVGDAVEWDPNKSAALFKAIRDNDSTTPFVVKTTPAATK